MNRWRNRSTTVSSDGQRPKISHNYRGRPSFTSVSFSAHDGERINGTVAHNCHGKTKSHGTINLTHGNTMLCDGKTKFIHAAKQNLLTAKQNLLTAKQRKRVGQRLLFAFEMVRSVTVLHYSLGNRHFLCSVPCLELVMFCSACGSSVDQNAKFCKDCGKGTFLNVKYWYLQLF